MAPGGPNYVVTTAGGIGTGETIVRDSEGKWWLVVYHPSRTGTGDRLGYLMPNGTIEE